MMILLYFNVANKYGVVGADALFDNIAIVSIHLAV
jgi:hypothetical protein